MKEQFIPYLQALGLKELGYSEDSLMTYYYDRDKLYIGCPQDLKDIPAPLWQQAFDWFREKHNILGNVYANASGYLFEWHDAEGGTHRGDSDFDGPNDGGVWDTYQEAREALLIRLISIIKKS